MYNKYMASMPWKSEYQRASKPLKSAYERYGELKYIQYTVRITATRKDNITMVTRHTNFQVYFMKKS